VAAEAAPEVEHPVARQKPEPAVVDRQHAGGAPNSGRRRPSTTAR
jgi:hypothetical protein